MKADRVRCKESVRGEGSYGSFHKHQCTRYIWDEHPEEGKCKVHHSLSVAERDEEMHKRWVKQKENDPWNLLAKANERIKELEAELAEARRLT